MPQFNGKQEATRPHREANLRCPRNGKRPDFAVTRDFPLHHTKPLGVGA
jgi:hypothetical protein